MAALETIGGGLIAGLVGLATVRYEMHAQRKYRMRRWKRRLDVLLAQLRWPKDDEILQPYHSKYLDISHRERVGRVIESLDNHLAGAERDFSDDFWDQYRVVVHRLNDLLSSAKGWLERFVDIPKLQKLSEGV